MCTVNLGDRVARWLRCCVTNRKVAGSVGYWPKWRGTKLKKVEHELSKIRATFCDGHSGRRIRPNIAGPTLGTILRSYDHDPTRGTHRGAAASGWLLLQCFGNGRSGTEIDPREYRAWTAGAWRHTRISGPWPIRGGVDVTQCCTWAEKCVNLLQCEVTGQGNVCEV